MKRPTRKKLSRVFFLVEKVKENPRITTSDLKRMALKFYRKYEPDLSPRTIERDIEFARDRNFITIKKRKCRVNLPEIKKYDFFSTLLPIGRHETDRFYSCRTIIIDNVDRSRLTSYSDLWKKVRDGYYKVYIMENVIGRKSMGMDRLFDIYVEIYPELKGLLLKLKLKVRKDDKDEAKKKKQKIEKTIRRQFERDIKKLLKQKLLVRQNGKLKENRFMLFGYEMIGEDRKREIIQDIKMAEFEKDEKEGKDLEYLRKKYRNYIQIDR